MIVRGLVKPEIDIDKLAQALLNLTRSLPKEEGDRLVAESKADPDLQRRIANDGTRKAA